MNRFRTLLSVSSCDATPRRRPEPQRQQRVHRIQGQRQQGRGGVQEGRGVIENKHSTDVDSPPPLHAPISASVLVLNDPPASWRAWLGIIENKHSADVESPPPIHAPISVRVLVLNEPPPAWRA